MTTQPPFLRPDSTGDLGDPRFPNRLAMLAAAAAVVIGVLLVRLWFLQVVSSAQYERRASANQVRTINLAAPRGAIMARDGTVLVRNRPTDDVIARPQDFKGRGGQISERGRQVLARLATRLGQTPWSFQSRVITALKKNPYEDAVLLRQADRTTVNYLAERQRDFPGIGLKQAYLRSYPEGAMAAQVLGDVQPIFAEDFKAYIKRGYVGDERVGKSGLESSYESYLAGTPGSQQVQVDAAGQVVGAGLVSATPPITGNTLRTSIDMPTQRALQNGIARQMARNGAPGGAGVAIDPSTGEILGVASLPAYDPAVIQDATRRPGPVRAIRRDPRNPFLDRAISGQYPVGSTFKPITAIAANASGVASPSEIIDCPAKLELFGQTFGNFRFQKFAPLSLPKALEVSCDTYFYELARRFYERSNNSSTGSSQETIIQDWARAFGLGSVAGIDVGGESHGLVPDWRWKKSVFANSVEPSDKFWKPGDTVNLSVGQGDFLATPLQMAVAYAAIANGGRVVTPTLAKAIVAPNGSVVRNFDAGRTSRVVTVGGKELTPELLDPIRQGLYQVANAPEGTGYGVFGKLPDGAKLAGKTGTAQVRKANTEDHSWFVGYAPANAPRIAVAVVIENAGTGASFAAPVVCETVAAYLRLDLKANPEYCGAGGQSN
ncbi:MAG: penicillin-binding protein 2 [Actinobacteria bacterium]|nr:penicillin-binding protein 2 [Actinomycetota bacterium]